MVVPPSELFYSNAMVLRECFSPSRFKREKPLGPSLLALIHELRGRGILGSSYPTSRIPPPLCGRRMAYSPARVPNPKPYILWCCIKMQNFVSIIEESSGAAPASLCAPPSCLGGHLTGPGGR